MTSSAPSAPALIVHARPRATWRTECLRAAAVVAVSALLGLAVNLLSSRPVPLLASDGPGALPERAERIAAAALQELLASQKAVLLLDVRRETVFAAAHPTGAVSAPSDGFEAHYQRLDLSNRLLAFEEIVLVCESDDCPSADRVAKFLKELQHTHVRVLYGGWNAYVQTGLPVEGAGR